MNRHTRMHALMHAHTHIYTHTRARPREHVCRLVNYVFNMFMIFSRCVSPSCVVKFISKCSKPALHMGRHRTRSSHSVSHIVVSLLHFFRFVSFALHSVSVPPRSMLASRKLGISRCLGSVVYGIRCGLAHSNIVAF